MRMSRDYVERNIQEIEAEGGRVLLNKEWEGVRSSRHTIVMVETDGAVAVWLGRKEKNDREMEYDSDFLPKGMFDKLVQARADFMKEMEAKEGSE